MKQNSLFENEFPLDDKYTSKIKTPIYEPKNKKPHILELMDNSKTKRLIREIEQSNVTDEEKRFLVEAAKRHTIFNYNLIADYYAHSSRDMQHLMERSALVIIDFQKSIEYGYTKLSNELIQTFLNEPSNGK